jgi:structure-specific recognition protein 1
VYEAKLNLSDELLEGKFKDKLQKRMEMDIPRLVSIITMHLTDVKVHTDESTSSTKFVSQVKLPCVRCDLNNDTGFLYPLVKQFVFLPKPTVFIQYQDVQYVEFQRLDNANRGFDLLVVCKRLGNQPAIEYKFQNMDKAEIKSLRNFCDNKKSLTVRASKEPVQEAAPLEGLGGGDEDDNDGEESDDSDFEGGVKSTGVERHGYTSRLD